MNILSPIVTTILAAALSLFVARAFAPRLQLLDRPSARKHHTGTIPLVGGVSIFVGGWIGLSVISSTLSGVLWPLFLASLMIVAVGIQDDRVELSVKPRFLVELLAVAVLVVWGDSALTTLGDLFGLGAVKLGWFAFPFTLFAVIGVINALNMVDGVDGLAGSLSLIALFTMGAMAWAAGRTMEGWVALLFAVALLPYLFCNLRLCGQLHRVFMGDAGSMLLGFIIAWLAIVLSQPSPHNSVVAFSPVTALWLFAIPLVDTVAIVVRRLLKGQSPFLPDRDHLHHIVMRMGYRDRHALLFITLSALMLAGFGLWMEFTGVAESIRFALFLGFAALYMVLLQRIWRVIRWLKLMMGHLQRWIWIWLMPLTTLSSQAKRVVLIVSDGLMIYSALAAALVLRYGSWEAVPLFFGGPLAIGFWLAPLLAYPLFGWFGLYRSIVRFFGSQALWAVTGAVTLYGLLYAGGWLLLNASGTLQGGERMSHSVLLLHVLLLLLAVGGSRMVARRLLSQTMGVGNLQNGLCKSVVIVGAGDAGRQLASGLHQSQGYKLCGFVDERDDLQGRVLLGHPIISSAELEPFIEQQQITDLFLADEQLDVAEGREQRNHLLQRLRRLPVRVRVMPNLEALANGQASWQDIDELDVADLLQREIVMLDQPLLEARLNRKTLLVLGAGGTIGSELCRQLLTYQPRLLLLYEQNEQALQAIYQDLLWKMQAIERSRERDGSQPMRILPRVLPLLGSIQDDRRLTELMQTWRPDLIYHAAAHKQLAMVESNVTEGVKNNVLATIAVIRTAIEQQVPKVVLISTDQAACPSNMMGCTKRVAEMALQALMQEGAPTFKRLGEPPVQIERKTHLSVVRFGNVLDSSNSLVTTLRKQIRNGGPVTLAHQELSRCFLSIQEAVQLLLQAGVISEENESGELLALDMGEPVKIYNLAKRMVELSGLRVKDDEHPHGDIEIKITGLRPDEILHEAYRMGENPTPTQHARVMKVEESFPSWDELQTDLHTLQIAAENNDVELVNELLQKLVKGYKPDSKIMDHIYREQIAKKES